MWTYYRHQHCRKPQWISPLKLDTQRLGTYRSAAVRIILLYPTTPPRACPMQLVHSHFTHTPSFQLPSLSSPSQLTKRNPSRTTENRSTSYWSNVFQSHCMHVFPPATDPVWYVRLHTRPPPLLKPSLCYTDELAVAATWLLDTSIFQASIGELGAFAYCGS